MDAAYCELKSTYGHDAFLLEVEEQSSMIAGFLESVLPATGSPVQTSIKNPIENRLDYALIAELVTEKSERARPGLRWRRTACVAARSQGQSRRKA